MDILYTDLCGTKKVLSNYRCPTYSARILDLGLVYNAATPTSYNSQCNFAL